MAGEGEVIACHTMDEWKTQFEKAKESKKLIVIDFTASWCPPCRFIAPIFAELAKKTPHVVFFKVDVDELADVAKEYDVQAMPTFIYLKDGVIVDTVVGAAKEDIVSKVEKHATAPVPVATS